MINGGSHTLDPEALPLPAVGYTRETLPEVRLSVVYADPRPGHTESVDVVWERDPPTASDIAEIAAALLTHTPTA